MGVPSCCVTMKHGPKLSISSKLSFFVLVFAVALLATLLPDRPLGFASEHGDSQVHAVDHLSGAEHWGANDRNCCQTAHCLVLFLVTVCQDGPAPFQGVPPMSASLPLISIEASGIDPPPKAT
jgi:hypothetical protein